MLMETSVRRIQKQVMNTRKPSLVNDVLYMRAIVLFSDSFSTCLLETVGIFTRQGRIKFIYSAGLLIIVMVIYFVYSLSQGNICKLYMLSLHL